MAKTKGTPTDIISAWQTLIEKSVKANTTFFQESTKIFSDILSKKIETKDLLKINTEVLSAAANNLIKLNIANTENLLNFGVNISKGFFSFNNSQNTAAEETRNAAPTSTTQSRSQINLSVKQGQQLTTYFYLNSHNAFSQNGRFYFEEFINENSGKKENISMTISPSEFMLEPGKSLKVEISIVVNKNIPPGNYVCTVKLDGMDNQEFDVTLKVLELENKVIKSSKTQMASKKIVAKKIKNSKPVAKKSAIRKAGKK